MAYDMHFHCGAVMRVQEVPDPAEMKRGFREIPVSGTPFRLRMYRVVVNDQKHLRLPDGSTPDCSQCKGCRRKSGRQEYFCFPDDYESNAVKYEDKRFFSFAIRRIVCFPAWAEVARE